MSSKELDLSDLKLLKDGHCLKGHALAVCQLAERETEINIRGTSLGTLVHFVSNPMDSKFFPVLVLSQLLQPQAPLKAIRLNEVGATPAARISCAPPNYPMF